MPPTKRKIAMMAADADHDNDNVSQLSIVKLAGLLGLGDIDEQVCRACDDLFETLIDTKRWLEESRRTAKEAIANDLGQQMVPKTPRRRRYRTPTTFSVLTAMNRGSSVHVGRTCARTKTKQIIATPSPSNIKFAQPIFKNTSEKRSSNRHRTPIKTRLDMVFDFNTPVRDDAVVPSPGIIQKSTQKIPIAQKPRTQASRDKQDLLMQKLAAEQKRRASALRKRDELNRLKVEKAKKEREEKTQRAKERREQLEKIEEEKRRRAEERHHAVENLKELEMDAKRHCPMSPMKHRLLPKSTIIASTAKFKIDEPVAQVQMFVDTAADNNEQHCVDDDNVEHFSNSTYEIATDAADKLVEHIEDKQMMSIDDTQHRSPSPSPSPVAVKKVSHTVKMSIKKKVSHGATGTDASRLIVSKKPVDVDNYGLDDLDSNDGTDDEAAPRKKLPDWAQGLKLNAAVVAQYHQPINTAELFGEVKPPNLIEIFGKKQQRDRFLKRTSSAIWDSPIWTAEKAAAHIVNMKAHNKKISVGESDV